MFHSSSSSKSPNCSFDAMSFAWPSFRSTPLTISQQSFAPGVSHIFGALSVLKMRHALMLLPSKSDVHGPAFGAGWNKTIPSSTAIVRVMTVGISRRYLDAFGRHRLSAVDNAHTGRRGTLLTRGTTAH